MAQAAIMRNSVLGVAVSVITRERHNLTAKVTRYGVENGATIADNIALNPNQVEVAFEMTNTNLGAVHARLAAMNFVKKRESRGLCTLDTEHLRYKNMVIEGINIEHAAPNKGAFKAVLRLAQAGITGITDMIEASGGRTANVLANDGTSRTASGLVNGGNSQALSGTTELKACQANLARK